MAVSISAFAGSLALASGPGTSGGQILEIPVGARAIAMGEAYTAMADDVSSLYWNPAGIALLNQSQASFMYDQSFMDMNYSYGAVATPLENGGLGASLSYLGFGPINGYDTTGAPTGNVKAYSDVATIGGAWLGDFWSAGFNAKGVQGTLADVNATGFASDVGVNLIYPREVMTGTLRLGATIRNLGTGMKYLQYNDPFPTEYRVGLAAVQMMDKKLNLSMDYGKVNDANGAVYAGAEYWLGSHIALRTGYAGTSAEGSGLRAGIGLRVGDLSFDYAYSQNGDLGMTNRYEMTYRFGAIRPLLSPEERAILRRGKQAMAEGRYGEAVMLFNSLIDLEPTYKPVRRLIKTAMGGYEKQDEYAKNLNKFKFAPGKAVSSTDNNPGEMAELEQLLNLSNDSEQASVMKPSASKEKQQ